MNLDELSLQELYDVGTEAAEKQDVDLAYAVTVEIIKRQHPDNWERVVAEMKQSMGVEE